jgi:hypothetical protein
MTKESKAAQLAASFICRFDPMSPVGTSRAQLDVRVEPVMRGKADTRVLSIEIIHKIHDVSVT